MATLQNRHSSKGTVLVTGATDGIGKQTAFDLNQRGFRVLVHGRTQEKAAAVASAISGPGMAHPVACDLGSLSAVRTFAKEIEELGPVDVLIHNAGVFQKEHHLSVDGFEVTFAVNHLAPFLLTHLLLPALRSKEEARIINVSSVAHTRGRIDFDDLQSTKHFDGYAAYAASKLANVLFTYELARRLGPSSRISVNALHPGVITTKLLAKGFGMSGSSLEEGAATSVYLASEPALLGVTGRYFSSCREIPSSRASQDEATARRLYEVSAALTGIDPL